MQIRTVITQRTEAIAETRVVLFQGRLLSCSWYKANGGRITRMIKMTVTAANPIKHGSDSEQYVIYSLNELLKSGGAFAACEITLFKSCVRSCGKPESK